MSTVRFEDLLQEISPEYPSGEHDLEYDPDFMRLEKEVIGSPAVEVEGKMVQDSKDPDWSKCTETALKLLERAHDLRVAVYLTRALLHTEGLAGLYSGLELICGYIQNFWDTFYPRLDPDEDNNPSERVNILEALNNWDLLLASLIKVQLCASRTAGSVNLRQYRIAAGKASELLVSEEERNSGLNLAGIEGAFTECGMELLESTSRNASGALAEAKRLRDLMNEKVGSDIAPDLEKLIQILGEIEGLVQAQILRRDPAAAALKKPDEKSGDPHRYEQANVSNAGSFDRIESREDVLKLLEKICAYYELSEPTSPVPYLLRRAMRLVTKNFMEIIEDLAPDSIAQVQMVCGPKEQQE